MAAALTLSSSLSLNFQPLRSFIAPKFPPNQPLFSSRSNLLPISEFHSSRTCSRRKSASFFVAKAPAAAVELIDPEIEITGSEAEIVNEGEGDASEIEIPVPESSSSSAESEKPQRDEVFAVVMVGSRQYIVFPGRYIYTQRLKGANVNDKIKLNKVLLVGTKTSTYIGKPIVANATVEAIVEEQALDKKVIVFKYKKKKHYRRNIGHRQPISRIRIASITGYQDSPAVTLS